jgi:hypothetical protein
MTTTELAVRENEIQDAPMTALQLRQQVNLVQEVMRAVMRDGEHYGKIPGCGDKPTLLQPGAQKLIMTFKLVPDPEVTVNNLPREHREYRVKVRLYTQRGILLGSGIGSCCTMEGKFRYRTGPVEFTDKPVPREYWDIRKKDPAKAMQMLGAGHVPKKNEQGLWVCAIQGEKVEHDNPADYYNTCEKMAYKRALVSATLTVTAASDIFTQDVEDMPEVIPGATVAAAQSANTQPAPAAAPTGNGNGKGAAVLDKMKQAAPPAPVPSTTSAPAQVPTQVPSAEPNLDAAWLSQVLDCEDFLRGTPTGKNSLRSIRTGFKLEDGAYPLLPEHQTEYLDVLKRTVERMQKEQK